MNLVILKGVFRSLVCRSFICRAFVLLTVTLTTSLSEPPIRFAAAADAAGQANTEAASRPAEGTASTESAWKKYQAMAVAAFKAGRYDVAGQMYAVAFREAESEKGDDRARDMSSSLNGLAAVKCQQGKVGEAQPLYLRSLSAAEKAFGADSARLVPTLLDLASVYESQGNHAAAEPLYNRVFAINKAAFGPDHPAVARTLSRMAMVSYQRGKYAKSETQFKQARTILEKAPGDNSADLANLLEDYAQLLNKLKRTKDAEAVTATVKTLRQTQAPAVQGVSSPDTSAWADLLASQTRTSGQNENAESASVLARAEGADAKVAGALPTYTTLADVYYGQSRYADAEPLYKQVIAIDEKSLGADHPAVGDDLTNLGLLYLAQKRYAEAAPLFARAVAIYSRAYGLDNVLAVRCQVSLATAYEHLGRYADAQAVLSAALSTTEKSGANNESAARLLNSLGYVCYSEAKYADAESYYKRALTATEAAFGPDSVTVAACLKDYARVLRKLDKAPEADRLEARAAQISSRH